ncbi:MAG: hypothetical protein IJO81_05220 [Clostridia bacterium]|nr:hypothetical protein [Clostridia bacterium]
MTWQEKSAMLLNETLDTLRNKSPLSTFVERARLSAEAVRKFRGLPQPVRCGRALEYVLERASCPVEQHDILLGRFPEKVPCETEDTEFWANVDTIENLGYYTPDNGHTPFDWEEILNIGIGGYIEKCERELKRRISDASPEYMVNFLEGARLCYKAFEKYILRYADAARDAGLYEAEAVSRKIAYSAPEAFLEAVQLVLHITNIYSVYCVFDNATLCCGRMDDYLLPFYLKDVERGAVTEDDARCIIRDFNCKCALVLGRGEHQMAAPDGVVTGWRRNPMYDAPTYVIIGGYSSHGTHGNNPLTRLFLEEIHPRLENPVYVFRRTDRDDTLLFRLAADKMRQNSSLLIYNDETVIPSIIYTGVETGDAVNYTIHGCNWPDIQGLNTYRVFHMPLPVLIMESLFDGELNPKGDLTDVDSIYDLIGKRFREALRQKYAEVLSERNTPFYREYLRVSDCFKKGVLEAAVAGESCIKYPFVYSRLMNIGTAADMLSSLEYNVCAGKVSADRLCAALKADFEDYDDVLKLCINAPKYGHDDERADRHARRLMTFLTDIVNEETKDPETGERVIYAPTITITDMGHIEEGMQIGATPDGRRAGAPFSENLSPSKGQSASVTSLINSVTSLPFERISSGALNVRLSSDMVSGDSGLDRLTSVFDVYFRRGGMQMQLSVADRETLRAAQADPDSYRDLMVRITGYSAVFVDMAKAAQEEVISRDSLS